MTVTYSDFIAEKVNFERTFGFAVNEDQLSPILLPHQRDIVRWAVLGGRRALFESFGLGKSVQQLEILRLILGREGGRALIVCPLGVRGEFIRDARNLLDLDLTFIRRSEEVTHDGIYITNYESVRDGKLDPNLFVAVSLDEASVLRSYGSKTYQEFSTLFAAIPYRFVATATPSPNKFKELIHYAGFLGVMETGDALTRWFKRDSTKANNLTLHPHKADEFWLWLNTWAVFLQRPSDLGYSDEGYDLPDIVTTWHEVPVDHSTAGVDRDGQSRLLRDAALGVVDASREKRHTISVRIAKMMEIIEGYVAAGDADQIVLWCDLNDEQAAIEKALADRGLTFSSVHGSLSTDEVERRLDEWRDKETFALIGKPVMLGQGMNLQQCNKAIFVGVTHKFNDLIQATYRIQRFGQKRVCEEHFIFAESESDVVRVVREKWSNHEELVSNMSKIIRKHGLDGASITAALERSMGVERVEMSGQGWLVANNDCVLETRTMGTDSVDLIVTSIPFSNHYEYTPAYEDFGHTDDNDHFWAQMDFLTPQLLRVLSPGRMYCCHVKDRILFGNVTGAGASTVSPFHAEALTHGVKHGFDYMGMITVATDVVRENNQSYRLGWSENGKDGTKMGVGSPEYILLFRKPQTDRTKGYADVPVTKSKADYSRSRWQVDAHAFWRSSGDRLLAPEDFDGISTGARKRLFHDWTDANIYDHEVHVAIGERIDATGQLPATFMALDPTSAHPDIWTDINRMVTLNTTQSLRGRELHVCPLQLEIVDRLIVRYSNPGETVFDPFAGIGTVPVRALKAARRGRGAELSAQYFRDAVRYLVAMEAEIAVPSLFDMIVAEAESTTPTLMDALA